MGQKKSAVKKTATKKVVKAKKVTLQSELNRIQKSIKAPKNQKNTHSNFMYRSAEDICEGYKLVSGETVLLVRDEIKKVGDRFYVKALATLSLGEESISVSALAREPLSQNGMNEAQLTGSTSSYARKYALNGLFAIDDTKDADVSPEDQAKVNAVENALSDHETAISMIDDVEKLKDYWGENKDKGLGKAFAQMVTRRKKAILKDDDIT